VVQGTVEDADNVNVSGSNGNFTISVVINDETFSAASVRLSDGGVVTLTSERDSGNRLGLNLADTIAGTFLAHGAATQSSQLKGQLEALFGFGTNAAGANNAANRTTFKIGNAEAAFGLSSGTTPNQPAPGFGGGNDAATTLNTTNTRGFIDGTVQSVDVTKNGNAFDVSMVVGIQTFVAQGFAASNDGQMNLISTTDNDNVISFNLSADVADEGNMDTVPELQFSMERLLGLDPLTGTSPARFKSASANNDGFNGFEMGVDQTIRSSPATVAGDYSLSYDASKQEFKLTDGITIWRETATADPKQTVQFTNGITLNIGDPPGNSFDHTQDMTQMTFKVGEGSGFNANFQVSEVPGDDLAITLNATTVDALGLTGANINSEDEARETAIKLDLAINTVQIGLATIGAQQRRFDFIQSNIATMVENTKAARGTFYDVDVAAEMIDYTRAQTLMQAGISMMAQANQMPQQLLRLIG
jgi:flagellin-like hook-associated protein FlgL